MIHIFGGMWTGALFMALFQVDAHWITYAMIVLTALLYWLMGVEYGSK